MYFDTNGSCHGHDCMIVGFMSTYGSCHGHDCTIVDLLLPMVAVMVMII